MTPATRTRKLHRWLNLAVGIQVLIWAISGFYMVVVNLDFIRGNHLVRHLDTPLPDTAEKLIPTTKLLLEFEPVESISLKPVLDHPYFIVESKAGNTLIDAVSGLQRSPIDKAMAVTLARYHYNGEAAVNTAALITEDPPSELYARKLPLWRINFDDRINTSFYIDPHTAQLVTRRHDFWRIFDFFWMLHIMDYDQRTDINNNFLRVAVLLGILGAITGGVLLFYSFGRQRQSPD